MMVGILAARGGLKSAGKNALVGGVLLAAIEGLNIAVSRVLMPMMEKKSNEAGAPVDMMEPPSDPLRPRMRKNQPIYQPQPTYVTAGTSNGFNIDEVDKFQTDNWDATISSNNNSSLDEKESKPFWKIW